MIEYHPNFESRFLPHARTLSVWLPPDYGLEPHRRYPVFYMHDGQNLFDPHTAFGGVPWGVGEVAEREIQAGRVPPLIIVGVANTPERLSEYGPLRRGSEDAKDLSREYGRFLVEEVKPFIDATYRTQTGGGGGGNLREVPPTEMERERTAVGGSSMGGLISLHLCKWYPNVFGRCAAMSPSLWWGHEYFLRTVMVSPEWLNRCRVWLDVGEHEGQNQAASDATIHRTRRLAAFFAKYGLREGEQFHYVEIPGATHNEAAWGSRFDEVLRFLFGT